MSLFTAGERLSVAYQILAVFLYHPPPPPPSEPSPSLPPLPPVISVSSSRRKKQQHTTTDLHGCSNPGTVEEIFKDFSGRRSAILQALSLDVDKFYSLCNPEMENLCLYGHPNGTWEVNLPAEEVPPELPEPALGINFARDGMQRHDWLSLVAVHSDCWLLSVSSYFGARLSRNEKKRLFSLINDLPTLFEIVTGRKTIKDNPSMDLGSKSQNGVKRSIEEEETKSTRKLMEESYEDEEDEHGETLCGTCGGHYTNDEFWICCDVCERWYHGKCVKITPAKAESMKQYKCPSCCTKKGRQ